MKLSAIVLAGGQSKRMGTNKAFVEFQGITLIEKVIDSLKKIPSIDEIIIAANKDFPQKIENVSYVYDEISHLGPLSGILAGLKHSSHEYSFVVACDMPFVESKFISEIIQKINNHDVVVTVSDKGLEPLFGIYSKNCIDAIEKALSEDKRKIIDFYPYVNVLTVPAEELGKEGADNFLTNINTKEELQKAQQVGVRR